MHTIHYQNARLLYFVKENDSHIFISVILSTIIFYCA